MELQHLRWVPDREVVHHLLKAYHHAVHKQMGPTTSVDLFESICTFFEDVPHEYFVSNDRPEDVKDSRYQEEKNKKITVKMQMKAAAISLLRSVVNGTELKVPDRSEILETVLEASDEHLGKGEENIGTQKNAAAHNQKGGAEAGDSSSFDNIQTIVQLVYRVFDKIKNFHAQKQNAEQFCSLFKALNKLLDQVGELQVEGLTERKRIEEGPSWVCCLCWRPQLFVRWSLFCMRELGDFCNLAASVHSFCVLSRKGLF